MDFLMMLTTILVALITAVFGPIAVEWARNYFKTKPRKTPIHEAIEMNEMVDTQLEIILNYLNCDRVWVAQFHNGGHFYPTGKSIQKFSIFYEKTAPQAQRIQQAFQNVPCSAFPKALSTLYKEGELAIPSYADGNETYDLAGVSSEYGTKSFYLVGLYSLENHLIGVMAIAYDKEHKLAKDEWIYIRQKVGVVGTLLTNYLNNKK
jgi:GAF domain-containing protein